MGKGIMSSRFLETKVKVIVSPATAPEILVGVKTKPLFVPTVTAKLAPKAGRATAATVAARVEKPMVSVS